MLKKKIIDNPTEEQKADIEKQAIEEQHAILFIIGEYKYKCTINLLQIWKLLTNKRNIFLQACNVLSKRKNQYGGKYNVNKCEV